MACLSELVGRKERLNLIVFRSSSIVSPYQTRCKSAFLRYKSEGSSSLVWWNIGGIFSFPIPECLADEELFMLIDSAIKMEEVIEIVEPINKF